MRDGFIIGLGPKSQTLLGPSPRGISQSWLWKGMPTVVGPKVLVSHVPRDQAYEVTIGWPGPGRIREIVKTGAEVQAVLAEHLARDFRLTKKEALAFAERFPATSVIAYDPQARGAYRTPAASAPSSAPKGLPRRHADLIWLKRRRRLLRA